MTALKADSITAVVDDTTKAIGVGVWAVSDAAVGIAAIVVVSVTVLGMSVDGVEPTCNTGVGKDTAVRVEVGFATCATVDVGSSIVATVVDAGVTEFNVSGVESDSAQPKNPANVSRNMEKVIVRRRKSMGMRNSSN